MKFGWQISFYLIVFCLSFYTAIGQEESDEDENADLFKIDTPVNIDLDEKLVEEAVVRKKRRKKNVYYGIKTKRWFTK